MSLCSLISWPRVSVTLSPTLCVTACLTLQSSIHAAVSSKLKYILITVGPAELWDHKIDQSLPFFPSDLHLYDLWQHTCTDILMHRGNMAVERMCRFHQQVKYEHSQTTVLSRVQQYPAVPWRTSCPEIHLKLRHHPFLIMSHHIKEQSYIYINYIFAFSHPETIYIILWAYASGNTWIYKNESSISVNTALWILSIHLGPQHIQINQNN